MPPPSSWAVLPLTTTWSSVSDALLLMPPPLWFVEMLLLTVESVSVSTPRREPQVVEDQRPQVGGAPVMSCMLCLGWASIDAVRGHQPDADALHAFIRGEGWGERPDLADSRIRRLGYVPDDEIARLYRGASVLVYPALFEGFGMPIVEAMACGTPVVASAHPSLDEACGDAAVRVDPHHLETAANQATQAWVRGAIADGWPGVVQSCAPRVLTMIPSPSTSGAPRPGSDGVAENALPSASIAQQYEVSGAPTPDAIRGRVSAVNSVFIGASNQLGEFESGATAALLGPVGSVLLGGVGTLVVAGLWLKLFPALAQRDQLAQIR